MRRALLPALALAPLALASGGCGEGPAAGASRGAHYSIALDGASRFELTVTDGLSALSIGDTTVVVHPGVLLEYRLLDGAISAEAAREGADPRPPSPTGVWLNGRPLAVDGATLRIGDRAYGPIEEGGTFVVSAEGVTAAGEPLGSLP